MIRTSSPVVGRAIALAILAAIVGIVYLAVVAPIIATYANDQREIASLQLTLARYQAVAGKRDERQAVLATLERRRARGEGLLKGSNDMLIAATIQNRIKTLVGAGNGSLKSTQILPDAVDGKLRRVAVRGLIAITLPGLVQVFYELESATPYIFLDNVDIRPRVDMRRGSVDGTVDNVLDVRFDAYGYVQAGH